MRSLVFMVLIVGIGASAVAGCSGGSTEDAKQPQAGFKKKGTDKVVGGRGPEEGEPPTLPPGSYSKQK